MCLSTVEGTYYRQRVQEEAGAFFRKQEETLHAQTLILKESTLSTLLSSESQKQRKRLLHWWILDTGDLQANKGSCSAGSDPNKHEKNWSRLKFKSSFPCSYHETKLKILRQKSKAKVKITIVDFIRADFVLFRHMLEWIPWQMTLEERGVQDIWTIFKDHLLLAQDLAAMTNKKIIQRQPKACMNEQGASDKPQTAERSLCKWRKQRCPGGAWRLLSTKWWCQESQSPCAIEAGDRQRVTRRTATVLAAAKGILLVLLLSGEGEVVTKDTRKPRYPVLSSPWSLLVILSL